MQNAIAVDHGLLPCAKGAMAVRKGDRYCRGPRAIAVGRGLLLGAGGLLPWAKGYCRIYIPVSKGLVP